MYNKLDVQGRIQNIGEKLYITTGDPKSKCYLIQRISMVVQRGNAVSILSSLPAEEGLEAVFY